MFEIETLLGKRAIGNGAPCFIVAELSGNHGGDLNRAKALIDAAADAKVDAIKLQTYTPDTLTIDCKLAPFIIGSSHPQWEGLSLYELYQKSYTPWEWHAELIAYAHQKNLIAFSTPFDIKALNFLTPFHLPLIKIASFMVENTLLLEKIGQTKKPVILSAGLTNEDDLTLAINILKENGAPHIIILHCISAYPSLAEQMHLRRIQELSNRYQLDVGLSDHSLPSLAAIASLALGACVIEKHLTLSRKELTTDSAFSLEPQEFKELVENIRATEAALTPPVASMKQAEEESRIFKQSIYVVEDIEANALFCRENIRIIRPGYGLAPKYYREVLGKRAKRALKRGEALSWENIL